MRTVYYRPNRPKSLAHDIIFPPTSTSCIELKLVLCDFVNVEQFSILNWKSGYIGGPVNFLKSWVFEFEVGFNEVSEKGWGALTRAACLRSFLYFQFQFWIFKWHLRLKLKLKFKRGGSALTRAACLRSFLLSLLFILKTLVAERRHQRGSLLEKFWYFAKMQISNRVYQTLQDPLNQVRAPFYLKEKRSKQISICSLTRGNNWGK